MKKLDRSSAASDVYKRQIEIHEEIKTDISCPYGNIISRPFYCSHCTCNNRRSGQSADGSYFLYRVYFRAVLCYGTDDTGVKKR